MFFIFVSCAGFQNYYAKLEKCMISENYDKAQNLVIDSKDAYGSKNEFLYYIDLGLLNHLSDNYKQSNINFESAKKYMNKITLKVFLPEHFHYLQTIM